MCIFIFCFCPAAYSHVVENTAFFGDVALRFPRIVHHYYDRNTDWSGLLRWGLNFCNQTGVFTGGAHQHVLTLVRPAAAFLLRVSKKNVSGFTFSHFDRVDLEEICRRRAED